MAKNKNVRTNNPPNPGAKPNPNSGLQRQLVNLLNRTSQVSGTTLDQAGTQKASPILHSIMQMGYRYAPVNEMGFQNQMSDNDAITAAIHGLRQGYGLNQDFGNIISAPGPKGKKGTASGNLAQQLIAERMRANPNLSKADVRADLHDELKRENATLTQGNIAQDKNSTLTPAEQQAAQLASLSQRGRGGPQSVDPSTGTNTEFDPVGLANAQAQNDYYQKGLADIGTYNQNAQLLGGIVPEQLKPLYDLMVQQRSQEMQNNLDLMNSQMTAAPYIQTLKNAAADYRTAQKSGSGGNALDQALGVAGGVSGTGGQGGIGSGSDGTLSGLDLSRQIMDGLNYGQQMGKMYNQFSTPVISNNQLTYLRDFLPRSNKGASMVPAIAQYLGAQSYPQMGINPNQGY